MKRHGIRTETQGLHQILENGDVYIEESNNGRFSRISSEGLVWTYHNADDTNAGHLGWSRHLPAGSLDNVDLRA